MEKSHNQHKHRMSHSTSKNYVIVICTVNNNTFAYQCQDTDTST